MIFNQPKRRFSAVLAGCCLVHYFFWLWICYPGVMYGDNVVMLAESFPGAGIGDQHSVMFIWTLRQCHILFGLGIGYPLIWGLFFWHLGILLFCLALYSLFRSYWVLLFLVCFAELPFVSFALPHMQLKDFNMSAIFFSACGLLFLLWVDDDKKFRKAAAGSALLIFFLAITVRHNAIFAFIPFAGLFAFIFLTQGGGARAPTVLKISALSFLLTLTLLLGKFQFERMARDYENYFIHGCIFSFDLAGISVNLDEMKIPADRLMAGATLVDLKKVFNPAGWDPLWGGWESSPRILKGGENEQDYRNLRNLWFHTVLDHPRAYLKHRSDHFFSFLKGKSRNEYLNLGVWPPGTGWKSMNEITPDHLKSTSTSLIAPDVFEIRHIALLNYLERTNRFLQKRLGDWPYMMYPVYALNSLNIGILVAGFMLWYGRRPRNWLQAHQRKLVIFSLVVFLSGWIYLTGYFFVSVSSDWRYIHWSSLSFWVGLFLLIAALVDSPLHQRLSEKLKGLLQKEISSGRLNSEK